MLYGYARVSTINQRLDRQIKNINEKFAEILAGDFRQPLADENLEQYNADLQEFVSKHTKIYKEKYTGTCIDRPMWNNMMKAVKPGDTIVFDEVSRMSRCAKEGFKAYKSLYEQGINLIFIKEPAMNTDIFRNTMQIATTGEEIADIYIKATNEVLMILAEKQIKASFDGAEHEVEFLHKRISEGIARAKENGTQIGNKKGSTLQVKKKEPIKAEIKRLSKDFDGQLKDNELMQLLGIARNTYYKYKKEVKQEY